MTDLSRSTLNGSLRQSRNVFYADSDFLEYVIRDRTRTSQRGKKKKKENAWKRHESHAPVTQSFLANPVVHLVCSLRSRYTSPAADSDCESQRHAIAAWNALSNPRVFCERTIDRFGDVGCGRLWSWSCSQFGKNSYGSTILLPKLEEAVRNKCFSISYNNEIRYAI